MGKPCIMGRRTWESLPKKPLPGRMNIVVTRNSAYCADGAVTELSLAAAIARARAENTVEIAVIGGAEIYRESLSLADMIYLTEIHAEFEGDAYFPELESSEWFEVSREEHESPDAIRYAFVTLRRRNDAHATGN
jgi:dihydrofolate reductase